MAQTALSRLYQGSVAWYVTGRFYIDTEGAAFDAGYFADIKGLGLPMFASSDTQDETTAYFTFSAAPFTETVITNGDVSLGISPPGDWHMYYDPEPAGDFSTPTSFAKGARIATFSRDGTSTGVTIRNEAVSVLTFELKESVPFRVGGQSYDLAAVIPDGGVTQIGYGSNALQPGLPKYPEIKCFAGTATVTGPR